MGSARRFLECPPNFGAVSSDVYRSSFPRSEHFEFLRQLHLRSIIVLIPEPYPEENRKFVEENGIRLFQIGLSGNKEPFVKMEAEKLAQALRVILNPDNRPVLIHCNQGKHRTGCVVGCLRRLQHWSLSMIFDEYRRSAVPKARGLDQLMIELFDPQLVLDTAIPSARSSADTDEPDEAEASCSPIDAAFLKRQVDTLWS